MIGIVMKAGRWSVVIVVVAVLLGSAMAFRTATVAVPLVDQAVQIPLLTAIVLPLVAMAPLYSTFGVIEPSLVRSRYARGVTVLAVTIVEIATIETMALASADAPIHFPVKVMDYLIAAAPLSIVLIGDLGWVIPLVLGFASLVVGNGQFGERWADRLQEPVWFLLIAASAMTYWHFGPREIRESARLRVTD